MRITSELNLNLVTMASEIVDFYTDHNREISYDLVLRLLQQWDSSKYPIFKKMGGKLTVESPIVCSQDEAELSNFDSILSNLTESKKERLFRVKGIDKEKERFYSFQIAMLKTLITTRSERVKRSVLNNLALSESEIYGCMFGLWSPSCRVENQKKLTKQLAAFAKLYNETRPEEGYGIPQLRVEGAHEIPQLRVDAAVSLISEIVQAKKGYKSEDKLVMSIHPYDFVTASFNQSGWDSCFHPTNSYAKSPFALLADESTVITYVPSTKVKQSDLPVVMNSKKQRAFAHVSEEMDAIMLNKVYPNNTSSYSAHLNRLLTEIDFFGAPIRQNTFFDWDRLGYDVSPSVYDDLGGSHSNAVIAKEGVEDAYFRIGIEIGCMKCDNWVEYDDDGEYDESSWLCRGCDLNGREHQCECCHRHFLMDEIVDGYHCQSCVEEIESEIERGYPPTHYCNPYCPLCSDREHDIVQEGLEDLKDAMDMNEVDAIKLFDYSAGYGVEFLHEGVNKAHLVSQNRNKFMPFTVNLTNPALVALRAYGWNINKESDPEKVQASLTSLESWYKRAARHGQKPVEVNTLGQLYS